MNWSEEQKKVIGSRNCDLLVSAAAGSGKTAVLVERIISRITDREDPVSLDELLIMTFTRAAAEEMRERIGKALSERIMEEPDNSWLKLQRAILPRARISTIDSICQGLIRQYYQELDIDPGFRAAEESELKLLRMDILTEMMNELHEKAEEDFLLLVDSFSKNGMDERISSLIESLSSFADACEWPERFLDEQEEICGREENGTPEGLLWYEDALGWIRKNAEEYCSLLKKAKEACMAPGGPEPYLAGVEESLNYASMISSFAAYGDLYRTVKTISFSRLGGASRTKYDPAVTAYVKAIRDSFKTFVTDQLQDRFLLLSPEDLKLSAAGSAKVNRELIRLTREFRERYALKKRESNQVDFSDMEHLALRLLYEETEDGMKPSALADELAMQFKEIMIDEYQDSNGVQEALLFALSAERFGRPDIFMVGDVKQSIYRFRQAEPRLFIEKYHRYEEEGDHRKIELNKNFRSRREVLDSVNDVFDSLMREDLGGIEYDAKARLYPGASYPSGTDCTTEFLIMDPGAGEEDSSAEENEYRMIARRILELMRTPENGGFEITDKESGLLRPVRFRDISILMRAAKGHAEKLVDILSEYSIPAYFQNSTGYFSAPEVEIMLAALSIIDNPRHDTPLAAVMRSRIGGFSDDELALIRARYEEQCSEEGTDPGDFYTAVSALSAQDEKIGRFLENLNEWREIAEVIPVHMLLEKLYTKTGFYDHVSAGPGGTVRRKNLDMLLEKAESFSKSNYHGLFQFSRYIELQKKYETDHGEAGAVTENDDIVRVMTIHGSKGLEFPVVFLARMAAQPRADKEEGFLADRIYGLGGDYIDPVTNIRYPGLKKAFIKESRKREDEGEQLRLFYVAMTRAKEKLILTAARSNALTKAEELKNTAASFFEELAPGEKLPAFLIRSCHNWMDWLLLTLAGNSGSIRLSVITPGELEEKAEKENNESRASLMALLKEEPLDMASMEEQKTLLKAVYPWEAETQLKPKISVSEIKMRSFEDEEKTDSLNQEGALPESSEKPDPEDLDDAAGKADAYYAELWQRNPVKVSQGALRGTAFHRAMELLSYKGSANEQLEELKKGGRMDPESLELLDEQAVKDFLSSAIGQRMGAAHLQGSLHREQHFMVGRPACELDPSSPSHELQLLQGIIDAYIETEDGIILIDYKTDYAPDESALIRHYRTQLELYADALTQLTGKPVTEKIIYSTHLKREIRL